jgi:CheY-like chemotaxis protein/HPt (histidine-containing phosphotransfer) domain-containing protein
VRQVLVNLVSNAVKFTQRGEVLVQVNRAEATGGSAEACGSDAQRFELAFSVTDTGQGIDPAVLSRLFQPFSQADSSTTRKYGGTGLGLAISRQLVEMMGGQITATSVPGHGSTFRFSVPLCPPVETTLATDAPNLRGVRLLIVEDNPTNREILCQQTEAVGMQVCPVPDGQQGLRAAVHAAATGRPFQVAILDMKMPQMNGLALAAAIRREPSLAQLPLIMLTSLNSEAESTAARDLGICFYLSKPVRRIDLYRRIAETLRKTPPRAAASVEAMTATTRLGGRVLLAEDNPVNQAVAQNMIEAIGCDLTIVSNGVQAVATLAASPFDLVLMDCQMPEMDGFAATGAIRAREARRRASGGGADGHPAHIPIIAVTAHAMEADRDASLAAGMDDHLSKPFSLESLRAVLEQWMPAFALRAKAVAPAAAPGASAHGAKAREPAAPATEPNRVPAARLDPSRLEAVRSLKTGGPALARRVIHLFLETTPAIMATLRLTTSSGNAADVGRAAHSLRGSSRELGADRVAQLCQQIESLARGGRIGEAAASLPELEDEYEAVRRLLTEQIEPVPANGCPPASSREESIPRA